MRVLLVSGGRRMLRDPLTAAVSAVQARGGEVAVVSWLPLDPDLAGRVSEAVELRRVPPPGARWTPPTGGGLLGVAVRRGRRVVVRGRVALTRATGGVQQRLRSDPHPRTAWERFRHSPQAMTLARQADVLVAADGASIRTVWLLARRNREAVALSGLPALHAWLEPPDGTQG